MLQRLDRLTFAFLLLLSLASLGCRSGIKRATPVPAPNSARGTAPQPRPLVIPESRPNAIRPIEGDDPAQLIPPPPSLTKLGGEKTLPLAEVPPSPSKSADLLPVSIRREANPVADLKALHERAVSQYARVDSFEARLTRREFVNGREQPKEVMQFLFRKSPMSVRMRWINSDAQGREVLFVQGKYDNKVQIMPARGDTAPLPPFRMAFTPDDPMIRSRSRHDIRQAGLAEPISHLGVLLSRAERNPSEASRLRLLNAVSRAEFPSTVDAIEETIRPGEDRGFPNGGRRTYFFDPVPESPSFGLPVLVIAVDEKNRELEYYFFDRFVSPAKLDAGDFDVNTLATKH